MLKIKDLKCSLGGAKILDIKELTIKENGLYIFVGPSGCGKTTLLNIIAGLTREYSGKMSLFNYHYHKMKEAELVRFRAAHLSIFFQHNVFVEALTLGQNLSLTSLNHTKSLVEFNQSKLTQLAVRLRIENLLAQNIKTLSGGEKTRGALGRTLAREAPCYLFDEPTAALDGENAIRVMDEIKERAKRAIILLVTHDLALAKKYASEILTMKEGSIVKRVVNRGRESSKAYRPQFIDLAQNDHYIATGLLKTKKVRHFLTGAAINLGLLGLGLSLLLVNAVNTKLVSAFKGNFTEQTTYVTQNYLPAQNVIKSVSEQELLTLGDHEVGAIYLNDMFMMFPSGNNVEFEAYNTTFRLPSFHVGLFNEALFLKEIKSEIFPYVASLTHDEIGLVLPYDDYKLLQNAFRLPFRNSPVDLGQYLSRNNVILTLNLGNAYWDYFDAHAFRLKSVMLGQEPQVIMGKPRDVITLFEHKMSLPSSLNLTKNEEFPWVLKKVSFVLNLEYEEFLWKAFKEPKYMFFTANRDYFNFIFTDNYLKSRILIFETPPFYNTLLFDFKSSDPPAFYTFTNGLTFISEYMLLGYSQNFFIAREETLIDDLIQVDISEKTRLSSDFLLSEGVINLAVQYNGFGSFNFAQSATSYGLFELGISSALAKKLYGTTEVVGENLYIGALTSVVQSGEEYLKDYDRVTLTIKEVISSNEITFYHHPLWNYLLFKDVFNVSPLALNITGVIYEETTESNAAEFWYFSTSKPFAIFKETINTTLTQLEYFTLIGAFGAFLLSTLITFLVVYLLITETNEQFSGLYLMGYSKEAIQGVVTSYISRFLGRIISIALIELFVFSFVIEFALNIYLKTEFHYIFNIRPYLLVVGFALLLLISLLFFFKGQMEKMNLLAFSKRDL